MSPVRVEASKARNPLEDVNDASGNICNNVEDEFAKMCLISNVTEGELDLSHLKRADAERIQSLVTSYEPQRNTESPVEMKILLTDDIPVYQQPRRLSYADKCVVDDQVAQWLTEGIVQPSCSEYASPIVLVAKKNGEKRLCCDYRRLNQKIVRDHFPMPLIDDVIERLQAARVFTTLDLTNGFFHVPVEAGS